MLNSALFKSCGICDSTKYINIKKVHTTIKDSFYNENICFINLFPLPFFHTVFLSFSFVKWHSSFLLSKVLYQNFFSDFSLFTHLRGERFRNKKFLSVCPCARKKVYKVTYRIKPNVIMFLTMAYRSQLTSGIFLRKGFWAISTTISLEHERSYSQN